MYELVVKSKDQITQALQRIPKTCEDLYINVPLTANEVVKVLNSLENLNTIRLSPSAFQLTSQKVKKALAKSGLTLKINNKSRGRPNKYSPSQIQSIKNLYSSNTSARQIAKNLNIPIRTVYSLLKV